MSKDRARRRSERQREAAIRAAAIASVQERRERQRARRRAFRAATTDRVRVPATGRPVGLLARRRRRQTSLLVAGLVLANLVIWALRPDWPARLGALVVTVLTYPVLRLLVFGRA